MEKKWYGFTRKQIGQIFDKPKAIIVIGQSASGKGTLLNVLKQHAATFNDSTLVLGTGDLFRENISTFSPSMKDRLVKINDSGNLQSPLIATSLWLSKILKDYTGGNILVEGSPRSVDEAKYMLEIYRYFLDLEMFILHLEVSDAVAEARMIKRNNGEIFEGRIPRADCATPEARKTKLAFYQEHVLPAIHYLEGQTHLGLEIKEIDGEKTIPEVCAEAFGVLFRHSTRASK